MEAESFPKEVILELVKASFEQISAAQWALLVAGTPDSETKAIIADTIGDMIQRISSNVVRHLLPAVSEHLRGQASQAQVSNAIDRYSPKLSECITETFAAALDLPPQKYEGAGELTTLVESEVKHRVTSALSVARNAPEWPSDPTLFIRGTMSSVGNLASIFRKAVDYLVQVFSRARTPCVVLCGRSTMKVGDMTDAVSGILLKWSRASKGEKVHIIADYIDVEKLSKNSDQENLEVVSEHSDSEVLQSAQLAALDITRSIIQEPLLSSGDRVERLTRFNLNLKLISNKVKNFFRSQVNASPNGNIKLRRLRFFKFARMQFTRMLGRLKRAFKNQEGCLVCLRPDQPKSPRGDSKGTFRSSTLHVRPSQNPVFEFEAIQDMVAKLFEDLSKMEPEVRQAKIQRYMDEKLRGFSQELTSRLYEYVMSCQSEVYEVPSSRSNTPFMDSVLWGRRGKKHWDGGQKFSPEVLYAMTEDVVWRFLQQLLLWMETEDGETYADEVSGAVGEINQLVVTALNTSEDSEEEISRETPLNEVVKDDSLKCSSYVPESRTRTSASSDAEPLSLKDLSEVLAFTLTMQLGQRLPRKCKKSLKPDALMLVVQHLSSRALKEIGPGHMDNIETLANLEEVIIPVVKKLLAEFGTPDKLVEAVTVDEASFDDVVMKHLEVQLKAPRGAPKGTLSSIMCCYPCR
ncbi:uncharacterized protein LOC133467186 [Phyllopteryx taeniolatus]|uniref:uncharacterized protein LOC133467186 n=1 Tax=Phyllopteryx taeniolatus TaxID=161469 RepID=UPI002AD56935|nr:uncharacterized protein LOC133467186 [Phyllopteryx taeniolatus]